VYFVLYGEECTPSNQVLKGKKRAVYRKERAYVYIPAEKM